MKKIIVTIEPQHPIDDYKYVHNTKCYLADALHKEGYEDFEVKGWGRVVMDDKQFRPEKPFNYEILADNFKKGELTIVTLVEQ